MSNNKTYDPTYIHVFRRRFMYSVLNNSDENRDVSGLVWWWWLLSCFLKTKHIWHLMWWHFFSLSILSREVRLSQHMWDTQCSVLASIVYCYLCRVRLTSHITQPECQSPDLCLTDSYWIVKTDDKQRTTQKTYKTVRVSSSVQKDQT